MDYKSLDLGDADADEAAVAAQPHAPTGLHRRIERYMSLFAAIKNGSGLHRAAALAPVFMAFVPHSDWRLGRLCVEALLPTPAEPLYASTARLCPWRGRVRCHYHSKKCPLLRDSPVLE